MDTFYLKSILSAIGKCNLIFTACIAWFLSGMMALISPASAQSVLFDFNNAPPYTSLPIDLKVCGITAHFSATGQGFSIQSAGTMGFTPPGFSGYCIYPNSVYPADLLVSFDQTLNKFSIMYACQELGCDDAATMRVTAYMNNSYVGTNTRTATFPGTWPVDTLSCSFLQGFNRVVVHYASPPPTCQDYGPIFMADNMRVTASTLNVTGNVTNAQFNCYNASNSITVAGGVTPFLVVTGGSTTMIAGQNIKYLPTTTVQSGGYLWGHIAPSGPWCVTPSMPAVAMAQDEIPRSIVQSSFKVYPNPTTGNFILELAGNTDQVKVDIYVMWGEKLLSSMLTGERRHEFSLSDKPVGVYFIRVVSGDKVETVKIIKQ